MGAQVILTRLTSQLNHMIRHTSRFNRRVILTRHTSRLKQRLNHIAQLVTRAIISAREITGSNSTSMMIVQQVGLTKNIVLMVVRTGLARVIIIKLTSRLKRIAQQVTRDITNALETIDNSNTRIMIVHTRGTIRSIAPMDAQAGIACPMVPTVLTPRGTLEIINVTETIDNSNTLILIIPRHG